uniref:Uncharacterized protein n=1 Tax=virus sp. ctrcb4 TaxID=2825824 RepID=A0A8S5RQ05_9VIRU|nr:MAG TPA: hypothetical protein [virus sp. ctrcb4]
MELLYFLCWHHIQIMMLILQIMLHHINHL